tara:strand:+ start:409 stop:684 length:276 start_codon:yes stop_codon:yes gene_type:complete
MTDKTTAVEGETQEQAPGLSLNDILTAVQIIDVTVQRGAFKGEELVTVSTIRERMIAFLRHAKEQGQEVNLPPSMHNTPEEPTEAEEAPAV